MQSYTGRSNVEVGGEFPAGMVDFKDMIRVVDVEGKKMIVKGYRTLPTKKYGDMIILNTDLGFVSTYSGVILSELKEWEKGFPFEAKIVKVNNKYWSFSEP